MSARRAIWRWGWRLFRQERRDQSLIFALIATAVAISLLASLALFHVFTPDEAWRMGSTVTIEPETAQRVAEADPNVVRFLESRAEVPGSIDLVVVRSFDPQDPILHPLVELGEGSWPTGPGEVVLTGGAVELLRPAGVALGDMVEFGDVSATVVGFVENPTDLGDEFALVDYRDPPDVGLTPSFFTRASMSELDEAIHQAVPGASIDGSTIEGPTDRDIAKMLSTALTTFAMLLVGLLAASGFGVVARRRLRQYGMLGAIGASERNLRGAAAANGLFVGLCATAAGTLVAVLAARLLIPRFESAVGHRIGSEVPVSIVLPIVLVSVVMSGIAAWWPARALANQPVVDALAARRPRSHPVRATTTFGAIASVVGYVLMVVATREHQTLVAVAATVLVVLGMLLLAPAVVAAIGRLVASAPLPMRIAGRDLARFQSRAAAALGAVFLALAVPVGVGVVNSALDERSANQAPNLPTDTAIVWASGVDRGYGSFGVSVSHDESAADEVIADIRSDHPELSVASIQAPVWPKDQLPVGEEYRDSYSVLFDRPCGMDMVDVDNVAMGTRCFGGFTPWIDKPELRELLDIDAGAVTAVSLVEDSALYLPDDVDAADRAGSFDSLDELALEQQAVDLGGYRSFSRALISEDVLSDKVEVITVAWLVRNVDRTDLTPEQIVELRDDVADDGLVEATTGPRGSSDIQAVAALIGTLVGLSVLAATVTLILSENAAEARVLAEVGAPPGTRRSIAASTAGFLAFGGALLALPVGYLSLIVARSIEPNMPRFAVPWTTLAIVLVLFPLVAAAASALLNGRTPTKSRAAFL